ncbi:MAG: DUF2252 domain-containing protein [Acidimicrobiia bacterium]
MTSVDPHIEGDVRPTPVVHLDVAERVALGKAARRATPRSSHAEWTPSASRTAPAELLASQETTRVPELLSIRHQRMLESPFTFYRGAAIVMASDLASTPDSGLRVQCCGDAHLANFGGFAAPDRTLVFDINDFDETNPGPFDWDVKRLAASFEIAARSREFSAKKAREMVLRTVRSYRETMAEFAGMTNLDTWYARLDLDSVLARFRSEVSVKQAERFEATMTKARSKDSTKAFTKLACEVDGEFRITSDPPFIVPLDEIATQEGFDKGPEELRNWIHEEFRGYRESLAPELRHLLDGYRLVDIARKVVGVGSVGTRCWIGLLLGKDNDDPLFLQIKEAGPSVLEPFASSGIHARNGQRVVEGQRLLQAAGDIFLGWRETLGLDGVRRDYYFRQLWDWKVSADLETMTPESMRVYAQMCGGTLARGHARSGDRIAIASYLGSGRVFDEAIADFAAAYADQNERDYEAVASALHAPSGG